MSFFTQIFSASTEASNVIETRPADSVLSATGLSRPVLADLFRRNGLFGAESDLAPVEQAIVQSRLGFLPGIRPRPVLAPTDARLVALENFTDAVRNAGGSASAAQRRQLSEAGFRPEQISEVLHVVRNVIDVFGARNGARPTSANDARYVAAA